MTLSIIIPAYNASGTIGRCLDSVLESLPSCAEVIVIDDGSTDSTASIVRSYGPAVRLICQGENRNPVGARAAGVGVAGGEYVAFVDADDTVEPGIWESVLAEAEGADMVIYGYDEISGGSSRKGYFRTFASQDRERRIRDALSLRTDPYLWTKMVRRSILKETCAPPASMAEDWAISVQCLMLADKVMVIDRPLYHYHVTAGSLSHDSSSAEKVIGRAMSEKANVEFICRLLESKGLAAEYSTEMEARKTNVRQLLFPALKDRKDCMRWKRIFPEINWRILFNGYVGPKYKIKHILAMAGLLPIAVKMKGK